MVRRHGDMCRIGCGLARKGHTLDQCGSQIRDADGHVQGRYACQKSRPHRGRPRVSSRGLVNDHLGHA